MIFDETKFLYNDSSQTSESTYDFLEPDTSPILQKVLINHAVNLPTQAEPITSNAPPPAQVVPAAPEPPRHSVWLYKEKFDAHGTFKKHKARLVGNGKLQEEGIDFSETFSPVVKPATIPNVLHVTLTNDWPVYQLDVQNAFLHDTLDETVYMSQPPGFVDKTRPNYVGKLNCSICGLKQAPRAWNARFVSFIMQQGFKQSKSDASLFVYKKAPILLTCSFMWTT